MTASAHRVQFYETSCRDCRRTFPIPLLGDQSHGQFIFHGEKGGVFGFLFAIEEQAWKDMDERLGRAGLFLSPPAGPDIEHFQRVLAACADPINGQKLLVYPICSGCGSRAIDSWDSKPLNVGEIPSVSFRDYQLLSDHKKMERLREL